MARRPSPSWSTGLAVLLCAAACACGTLLSVNDDPPADPLDAGAGDSDGEIVGADGSKEGGATSDADVDASAADASNDAEAGAAFCSSLGQSCALLSCCSGAGVCRAITAVCGACSGVAASCFAQSDCCGSAATVACNSASPFTAGTCCKRGGTACMVAAPEVCCSGICLDEGAGAGACSIN